MSILVATDFSNNAAAAVRTAARIARDRGRDLTVVHCLDWAADMPTWQGAVADKSDADYREDARHKLETRVDDLLDDLEDPPEIGYETPVEFPERALEELTRSGEFEIVVLGATGLDRVANALLGSLPEEVARRSPIPVLVVPPEHDGAPYDSIVAPVDFTTCSRNSLDRASDLAREMQARLTIVHAVPTMAELEAAPVPKAANFDGPDDLRSRSRRQLDEFLADRSLEEIDYETRLEVGSAHEVVHHVVDDIDADGVVMGTHGRRGFKRFFLGSTAARVLRQMPCSVMTVRTKDSE
jgi:nucleotide-binding universal stress UspA family protein